MHSITPVVNPDPCPNPPCIRFGEWDQRAHAFGSLLLWLDLDEPPYLVTRELDKLRALGFDIRLTEASATAPDLPLMSIGERRDFEAGKPMPWQRPDYVQGCD